MLSIEITEETKTVSDMSDLLRRIADMLEEGYTRGYGPDFNLSGEEEEEDEEE